MVAENHHHQEHLEPDRGAAGSSTTAAPCSERGRRQSLGTLVPPLPLACSAPLRCAPREAAPDRDEVPRPAGPAPLDTSHPLPEVARGAPGIIAKARARQPVPGNRSAMPVTPLKFAGDNAASPFGPQRGMIDAARPHLQAGDTSPKASAPAGCVPKPDETAPLAIRPTGTRYRRNEKHSVLLFRR